MPKVNVSVDDVSPHPMSSIRVLDVCEKVARLIPDVKFTLFVPTAYWRTVRHETRTSGPLKLSEHREFCDALRSLPRSRYEVGYHGHYHGIPGRSDNDEFQSLALLDAQAKFDAMFDQAHLAGLGDVFRPVFRPPAWRMSPAAIEVARERGIRVLALSSKDYAVRTYEGRDVGSDVVRYTHNPPFDPLAPTDDDAFVVYHACEWDRNHMSPEAADDLISWIDGLRDPKFVHMTEYVDGQV